MVYPTMDTRVRPLFAFGATLKEKLRRLLAVTVIAVAILSAGCGGSGEGSGLPPFVDGSVTDAEFHAAADAIALAFQNAGSGPDVTNQVLAAMRAQPKVVVARLNSSNQPVAWFQDGRKIVILVDSLEQAPPPAALSSALEDASSHTTRNLVSGKKAIILSGFLGAGTPALGPIQTQLLDKGFEAQIQQITVDTGPGLSNLDLLMVSSHGIIDDSRTGVAQLYYSTTTECTPELERQYEQQLIDGRMIINGIRVFRGPNDFDTKYFFSLSQAYLRERGMSFRPGAFWLSNACHSAEPAARAFADSVAGLTAYAGWSGSPLNITANETTAFVFDRLLGIFAAAPVDAAPPGPLTISELVDRLKVLRPGSDLRMNQSRNTRNLLANFVVVRPAGAAQANQTLLPSIRSTAVNTAENTVTIEGYFGTEQGPVTLNGSILTVLSWTETSIVVQKPEARSGTLLVRSIGAPSASGYLFSNSFQYQEPEPFTVTINPELAITTPDTIRTLTAVAATGTIPSNSRFRWTIVSGGGRVNGTTTVTRTQTTVEYRSAPDLGTDVIKLDVLNQAGQVIATKTLNVAISQQFMTFTVSGGWDPTKAPPNGTYQYFDGGSSYDDVVSEFAKILFTSSNIGNTDQTIGALITMGLAQGAPVTTGTWTKVSTGEQITPGKFQLTLSTNQANPDDMDSRQFPMGDSGSLTVTSVSPLSNGRTAFNYTFTVQRAAGGTVTGSGTGIITP